MNIVPSGLQLFRGILSYTEMHYRFRFWPFSRYYRKEPEIILDAPHRVEPGKPIPISLIIKDADSYPIQLDKVKLNVSFPSGLTNRVEKSFNTIIDTHWFSHLIPIEIFESGKIRIDGEITFARNGKMRSVTTHNIHTSPAFPLVVLADKQRLPGSDVFLWGDLHYHSNYTEDFVEFGAALDVTVETIKALGLDFLTVTDHSYDLDDMYGSWKENDPTLQKWKDSRDEIDQLNSSSPIKLVPGEEVTVSNGNHRNVHLLVYNEQQYIPGSGDGAEKWSKTRTEHSITEVSNMVTGKALVIAAHPFVPYSKLEQWLINRGKWEYKDVLDNPIHGLQILNGCFDEAFETGFSHWVKLLLSGRKIFIFAGNDAHGNFNRFHQIKIPMLSTWIHREQILGQCRTGIIRHENPSVESIIDHLKAGKCIITDGPSISLDISNDEKKVSMGDTIHATSCVIEIYTSSSVMFGQLSHVKLIHGLINSKREKIILDEHITGESWKKILTLDITFSGYFRAEIATNSGKRAYTNPIWVSPI